MPDNNWYEIEVKTKTQLDAVRRFTTLLGNSKAFVNREITMCYLKLREGNIKIWVNSDSAEFIAAIKETYSISKMTYQPNIDNMKVITYFS